MNSAFSVWDYPVTMPSRSEKAEKIIVQVNENMPRTFGRNFWHVSEVDAIVEANTPLTALPVLPPNENEKLIGNYIAELVEDGSTLQLGIGSIPSAVALALENKKTWACIRKCSPML